MQGELIHAVSYIVRAKYDPNMTQIATNATDLKYNLSLALELLDGVLSLCVNTMAIMTTTQMLDIFLNFARLYFLQDIDRIGYELIEAGFLVRPWNCGVTLLTVLLNYHDGTVPMAKSFLVSSPPYSLVP